MHALISNARGWHLSQDQFYFAWYLNDYDKTELHFFLLDVNECAKGNGGCNQKCINKMGSYKCECLQGFEMQADNKTCSGKNNGWTGCKINHFK